MSVVTYQNLALDWQPSAVSARNFHRITLVVLVLACALMFWLSIIKVPEQPKRERALVPDRIAEFIQRREKPVEPPKPIVTPPPKPVVEKKPEPKPEEKAPEPIETQQPLREKIETRNTERKPLTESQKAARSVAEKSGLLALANELNDLTDTRDLQAKVGKNLSTQGAAAGVGAAGQAAGHDSNALTSGIAQSAGGVNQAEYTNKLDATQLDARKAEKIALSDIEKSSKASAAGKARAGSAGEDVSLVFDRNKSALYSLYERERRSTPDLQGKIVFQLTISPTGEVIDVKIVSSDLNNPELEARLLSRIKGFKFKAGGDKPTTITYPVEFLPT